MEEATQLKQKGGKKTGILIVVILVVVLAAAGGAAVYSNAPARRLQRQIDLGNRYLGELDFTRAVAAFEDALRIDPQSEAAQEGLAGSYAAWMDAYAAEGDYASVGALYHTAADAGFLEEQRLATLGTHTARTLSDGAAGRLSEHDADGAIALYEEALAIPTDDDTVTSGAQAGIAEAFRIKAETGTDEEAIEAWEKLLEIDPQNVEAYFALQNLYHMFGDFASYEAITRRAAEETGDAVLREQVEYIDSYMEVLYPYTGTEAFTQYLEFRSLWLTQNLTQFDADAWLSERGWTFEDFSFYLREDDDYLQQGAYVKTAYETEQTSEEFYDEDLGYIPAETWTSPAPMYLYFGERDGRRYVNWTEGFGG